jgi:hypothetical protein
VPFALYCTRADVRAEGYPFSDATTYPDAWVDEKIALASQRIESVTGHWFTSLARTIRIDGQETPILRVPFPIVQVDTIKIIYEERYGADPEYEIDIAEVSVYNRHLTMGLLSPDDRSSPAIEVKSSLSYPRTLLSDWPKGHQNVELTGKFGFTELGASDPVGFDDEDLQTPLSEGSTPVEIKRACLLLVRRFFPMLGDFHGLMGATRSQDITRMKTRDQSISYAKRQTGEGSDWTGSGLTGDPEIDGILIKYKRKMRMAWA